LVRRHRLSARFALVVLVGLACAVSDAAAAATSITAMACCAKTNGDCAGVKAPDDCCRGMGHISVGPASTMPPTGTTTAAPLSHAVLPHATGVARPSASTPVVLASFKRPHDPPHLHPVALLI
jgi:hypothetical protein